MWNSCTLLTPGPPRAVATSTAGQVSAAGSHASLAGRGMRVESRSRQAPGVVLCGVLNREPSLGLVGTQAE